VIDEIIAGMESLFVAGVFEERTTFHFHVDGVTMTVIVAADSYSVERDTAGGKADCTCTTSAEMFRSIWFEGYKPGILDFLGGAIKADQPLMLPRFLKAFGK
jgi:hypothetical protein